MPAKLAPARRAHTVAFIIDGRDFFTAHLDDGGVRVGMVGGTCFDVPAGHAYYDRIVEAQTEADAEGYFDEMVEAFS